MQRKEEFSETVKAILNKLKEYQQSNGMLMTSSLFKLSLGSNKLRPYFKQFEDSGVFSQIIRKMLLPNSSYKISLYKNSEGEYAAFWLIGFNNLTDFESDSQDIYTKKELSLLSNDLSYQQIFYGAPGTGKSHAVNEMTKVESVIRTTFHPDSDYSTFVGAYKPTMKMMPITDESGKTITIGNTTLQKEQIVYEFVEQAFLQAYVQAWKYYDERGNETKKQYLIIEEINRGNCAQIFGDLFQLLDRNDLGFSVYHIHANKDIKAFLEKQFKNLNLENLTWTNEYYGRDLAPEIKSGEVLVLPNNLYIWATMNTSDQSLFPIDSAFKRRWDWEYEPIKYKNTDWAIDINGIQYSWTSFQKEVNERIFEATNSEDKMLGDFFVKPLNNVISEKLFLNKVLFYLWNDVCKDGDGDIFKTSDGTDIKFSDLYGNNGASLLHSMMEHLHVTLFSNSTKEEEDNDDESLEEENSNTSKTRFSINGESTDEKGKLFGKGTLVKRAVEIYCNNHPQDTAVQIRNTWISEGFKIPHIVETEDDMKRRLSGSRDQSGRIRAKEIRLSNGESLYVSTEVGSDKGYDRFGDFLKRIGSKTEWNINIQIL